MEEETKSIKLDPEITDIQERNRLVHEIINNTPP